MVQKTIPKVRREHAKENARVIFATYGIIAKGVDIPRLSGGVDATPRAKAAQLLGRTLRILPGKIRPIWITIADMNSFRSLFQLLCRVRDYITSNAEIFIWHPKKGRKPQEASNYQPIGTLRVCAKDGYLQRKVSDDTSINPAQRWEFVHRSVWVAANGPIPPGHIVVFKRGMVTAVLEDITTERLECITRAENMRRNSYHTRHPEMVKLYQLKGAINRQTNRIAR